GPIDDGDEARDDGPGTDGEAWFCRSDPRITQECRTTIIGAISNWRNLARPKPNPSRNTRDKDVHTPPGTARRYGAGGEECQLRPCNFSMECRDAPTERPEQVPRRPGPE